MALHVFYGPMMASKTKTLRAKLGTYTSMGEKVLYLNTIKDTRSENAYSTHDKQDLKYEYDEKKVRFLKEADVTDYTVIGVDEAQFFEDLIETVETWVKNGKIVEVAGLSGYANQRAFGDVLNLIAAADHATPLFAWCKICKDDKIYTNAPFTKDLSGPGAQVEKIGGGETYIPVCRRHL